MAWTSDGVRYVAPPAWAGRAPVDWLWGCAWNGAHLLYAAGLLTGVSEPCAPCWGVLLSWL